MAAADEEENMNKKAVFFDIDGTLYDHETGISDSTKEGIARLKENGHYAFICTGRSMAAVFDPELLGMGFDGIVAGCGTYVKLGEELLLNAEISQEKLCGLLDLLQAHRIIPVLEGCDYLYYHRKDYEIGDTDLYIRSLKKYIPDRLVEIEDHEGDLHVNKFSIQCQDPALQPEALERLAEDYCILPFSAHQMELIPLGHTKATGMGVVCSRLSIERNDVYAFGDSGNDVDMLRYAGCGIAMGNGSGKAKEAADYVTRGIRDHGIYMGLKEFGII